MLNEEEKKKIVEEISENRAILRDINSKLAISKGNKEKWFQEKKKYSTQIIKIISQIKKDKDERNKCTSEVQKLKKERKIFNDKIADKIAEIKKLKKEKKDIEKKYNIKGDPSKILENIDELEKKIERNPMSMDKEKVIVKQIKDLRKCYNEAKGLSDVWDQTYKYSKEIDTLKKEAEDLHRKIQNLAKKSQEKHEQILSASKEIDELKVKEDEAKNNLNKFNKEYKDFRKQLKAKLSDIRELECKINVHDKKKQRNRKTEMYKELEDKNLAVLEKIKNKQVITTEDLLVLQIKNLKK